MIQDTKGITKVNTEKMGKKWLAVFGIMPWIAGGY